jgi:hypothetical protein
MSPEQALGAPADVRADVYALGVTAFHAVTGRRPFEGSDGAALLAQQAQGIAPPVNSLAPLIPARFAAAIDRAILADPAARWPSVEQFSRELAEVRGAQPVLSAPLRGFARVTREQMGRGAMSLGLAVVTEVVLVMAFGFDSFSGVVFHAMASLLVGMAGMSLAGIIVAAHDLLKRGYGHSAAMLAMRHEVDEFYALPESMRRGDWRQSPSFVLLVGALIVAGAVGLVKASDSLMLGLSAILIAIYTPMIVVQRLQRSRGFLKGWWAKAMEGWFGRLIFRTAALGLGDRTATPTSGEPTAIALGGAVQALFTRLAEPQRKALAAVPELIARLEAMALDRANPQSTQAVMALETLRMDLLRLRAGDVAAESITTELGKLREIGYRVDAEIEVNEMRGARSEEREATPSS